MPLISTTGALSVNKVGLGASNQYWFLQWNDNTFAVEDIALDGSNQLFCTGGYQPSGFGFWINLKVNQDSGLPIIIWQKRFSGFTNLSGVANYYNRYNNTIYNVGELNAVQTADQSAGTIIYNRDGTISGQYIDNNQFYGASTTYPWIRNPDSVISDYTGDYWIAGIINEKPNSTTNRYLTYYSKFSGGTKIYGKVLIDATAFPSGRNTPVRMQFTSAGDLLILFPIATASSSTDITTLININPVTNTINWQIKWARPTGSTTYESVFTQDSSGNIYIGFYVLSGATAGVYLQKYTSAGAAVWTRKLTNAVFITDIKTDLNGYIYLVLQTTGANNNTIIKIDGNYNIQWQRIITTSSAGKSIGLAKIYCDKDNIYLLGGASLPSGSAGSSAVIIKLPNDGAIPGTGTYVVSAALTVTYTSSSVVSFISGTLGVTSTGTISIADATVRAYDPISLGANTTINTTTVTSL
jgi:hypothetical protein